MRDCDEQATSTPSSASPIRGGEPCSPTTSPESPSTTTCDLWVSNQHRELRLMEVAPALTNSQGGLTQAPFLLEFDLLCGGFPCQDLSVSGRRAGLDGEKSRLFFEFARIADALRPEWLLIENVPRLLSSNGGRDFGVVLGTLADLGYGLAWRVLNSRYFGVPQRRRRLFIVGAEAHGDPRAAEQRAGTVLSVGAGCERHLEAGAQAGETVAAAFEGRPDLSSAVAGTLGALTGGYRTTDLDGNGAYVVAREAVDAA